MLGPYSEDFYKDGQMIAVHCLTADMLHAFGHHDDPQCHLSDAEVMTSALVAAW